MSKNVLLTLFVTFVLYSSSSDDSWANFWKSLMVLLDQFPREVVFVAKILGADSCYCHSQITTTSPTRNSSPGPEKMSSFLGAQISPSYLPGKPIKFDPFSVATPNPYSSYSWAEMVLNPTLTPSTHSKIHPIKYQASNIEHCMINKNCRYIWSKLKLRKARNYPEIGWVKKGLYRAQFTNVKFAVHDKRH